MAGLQHVATLASGNLAYVSGVHDLQIIGSGSTAVLHSASGALGGITSFSLQTGWQAQFQTQTAYATTSVSYANVPFNGGTLQLSLTRLADMLAQADTTLSSGASGTPIFARNTGFTGDLVTMLAVTLPGGTYLFGGINGSAGIASWQLSGSSTLVAKPAMADSETLLLADVSALVSARVGAANLLVSASAGENGLSSFRIGADGSLVAADSLDARQNLAVAAPSAMKAVALDGQTYLLVASAGSSSLSVVRLREDGAMQVVDQVIDGLDTRFSGASVLECVTAGDRVFALVAGADDGLSLFTLLPGGRLLLVGSLADTASMLLDNVAAISAAVVGSEIQIFTSSQTEAGICQFRIDLTNLGQMQTGSGAGEAITGAGLDDLLAGNGGSDQLFGGIGADILLDGSGQDQMSGGQGADTFVLSYDGQPDTVLDFQPGTDQLDLSAWPLFYSAGQATLTQTSDGCVLQFGSEQLVLVSWSAAPLTIADFPASALVAMSRQLGLLDGHGVKLAGTSGSDFQIGASGNDLMFGSDGDDWIMGGAGLDTVRFAAPAQAASTGAQPPVVVDLKHPDRNTGVAAGDAYEGIEQFVATAADDALFGNGSANRFSGGSGQDRLIGRGGFDRLEGQSGKDSLTGGNGGDLLTGGSGADQFIFNHLGDSTTRIGEGDIITDFTEGRDKIVLDRLDANSTLAGDQAFVLVATGLFSGQAGELRVVKDTSHNRMLIQVDVDGNAKADFQLELSGFHTLTSADFIL